MLGFRCFGGGVDNGCTILGGDFLRCGGGFGCMGVGVGVGGILGLGFRLGIGGVVGVGGVGVEGSFHRFLVWDRGAASCVFGWGWSRPRVVQTHDGRPTLTRCHTS